MRNYWLCEKKQSLKEDNDILKKGVSHICPDARREIVIKLKVYKVNTKRSCKLLGVSRNSYYEIIGREESSQKKKDIE